MDRGLFYIVNKGIQSQNQKRIGWYKKTSKNVEQRDARSDIVGRGRRRENSSITIIINAISIKGELKIYRFRQYW